MAIISLTYLCLDIFDPDLDESQIAMNIISGAYCLHWFATFQLLKVLRSYTRLLHGQVPPADFIDLLELFAQKRENPNFDGDSRSLVTNGSLFEPLKKFPEIHELLQRVVVFHQLDIGTWKLELLPGMTV